MHSENGQQYSYGFDLIVLLAKLRYDEDFDGTHLDRIVANTPKQDFMSLVSVFAKVYPHCSDRIRFQIHKGLEARLSVFGITCKNLFDLIYLSAKKDFVYYGVLATKLNQIFNQEQHKGA
jgi:hypothetical protein